MLVLVECALVGNLLSAVMLMERAKVARQVQMDTSGRLWVY